MREKRERTHGRRAVTDAPMFVDPGLIGKPLATPLRRGAAFVADLVLVVVLIFLAIALVNHIRHPALLEKCIEYLGAEQGTAKEAAARDLNAELYSVIHARKPDLLPADVRAALEARDASALTAIVSSRRMNIVLTLDSKESRFNEETGMFILGSDVVTGFGSIAIGVPIFIAYFTFLTWAMGGKTPGKAMVRIRVTRLDGRRLSLWDSFGRAGGYAASAGTVFLGFLEAFWHPNRQTIHDRIAGTVVLRERRGRIAAERGEILKERPVEKKK